MAQPVHVYFVGLEKTIDNDNRVGGPLVRAVWSL